MAQGTGGNERIPHWFMDSSLSLRATHKATPSKTLFHFSLVNTHTHTHTHTHTPTHTQTHTHTPPTTHTHTQTLSPVHLQSFVERYSFRSNALQTFFL